MWLTKAKLSCGHAADYGKGKQFVGWGLPKSKLNMFFAIKSLCLGALVMLLGPMVCIVVSAIFYKIVTLSAIT